jgi:hypothetical protein
VARGARGVRVTLDKGEKLVVGSQRTDELAAALSGSAIPPYSNAQTQRLH